jgi:hypothetical protein
MLVLHDDAAREYAYGPPQSLPDTKVGAFNQEFYDTSTAQGWTVISVKNDWKRFSPGSEPPPYPGYGPLKDSRGIGDQHDVWM